MKYLAPVISLLVLFPTFPFDQPDEHNQGILIPKYPWEVALPVRIEFAVTGCSRHPHLVLF